MRKREVFHNARKKISERIHEKMDQRVKELKK